VATTPGPRTSFGSLLGRDSLQYPACFFEDDDDEAVPLRRKFPWKRSTSLNQEQRARREQASDERRSVSARLRSTMLCAGCCGGEE
jgi:Wiskott-Aldrich syndrome protein